MRISLLLWTGSQTSQETNGQFRHGGRDDKFGLSIGDHVRDVDTRCRFRQGGLLLSEVFRDSTFDMDQVFEDRHQAATVLARRNDRMAGHVC